MDITQIGTVDLSANLMNNVSKSTNYMTQSEVSSFSSHMQAQSTEIKSEQTEPKQVEASEPATSAYDRYQYKENEMESAKEVTISDKVEENPEKIEQFVKDIIASVSKNFEIEEDDVIRAMEELGLSAFDLMNPQNLAELVMNVTETSDETMILLDPKFEQLLQDVTNLSESFAKDLDLTEAEFVAFADLYIDNVKTSPIAEAPIVETEVDFQTAEALETTKNENELPIRNEISSNSKYVVEDLRTEAKSEETDTVDNKEAFQPAVREQSKEGMLSEQNESKEETFTGKKNDFVEPYVVKKEDNTDFSNHIIQQTSEITDGMTKLDEVAELPEVENYTSIDVADVIEQIVENTRIVLQNDSTTIEMQLNPENLGKIYLNMTSKEGAVTAQFYAQNEEVKAALEAQIVNLTENLTQAGVKVEAVEIAVATHEFERNLEQNAKQEEEQGKKQEEKKSARRSIRMDSLDELSGLMSEEEALVATMMKDNGNSVDFTA